MSVHVLTDGISHFILPIAQDHKKLGEGDTGPNTGGMGAYAPAPFATAELQAQISRAGGRAGAGRAAQGRHRFSRHSLHRHHLDEGRSEHSRIQRARAAIPKRRCCCRLSTRRWSKFSRPCGNSGSASSKIRLNSKHAVTIVLAAAGYPGTPETGAPIEGLDLEMPGTAFSMRGTKQEGGRVVTNGGQGAQRDRMGRRPGLRPRTGLPARGKNSFCGKPVPARYCRSADLGMKILNLTLLGLLVVTGLVLAADAPAIVPPVTANPLAEALPICRQIRRFQNAWI